MSLDELIVTGGITLGDDISIKVGTTWEMSGDGAALNFKHNDVLKMSLSSLGLLNITSLNLAGGIFMAQDQEISLDNWTLSSNVSDELLFKVGGVQRLSLTSAGVLQGTDLSLTGGITLLQDQTIALDTWTLESDVSDDLLFKVGGVEKLSLSSAGLLEGVSLSLSGGITVLQDQDVALGVWDIKCTTNDELQFNANDVQHLKVSSAGGFIYGTDPLGTYGFEINKQNFAIVSPDKTKAFVFKRDNSSCLFYNTATTGCGLWLDPVSSIATMTPCNSTGTRVAYAVDMGASAYPFRQIYQQTVWIRATGAGADSYWQIEGVGGAKNLHFYESGVLMVYFTTGGTVYADGTYEQFSCASRKRCIQDLMKGKSVRDALLQLRGREFERIRHASEFPVDATRAEIPASKRRWQTGFIAQEIEEIDAFKHLVSTTTAPIGPDKKEETTKGVNYLGFIVYLVQAAQEQYKDGISTDREVARLEQELRSEKKNRKELETQLNQLATHVDMLTKRLNDLHPQSPLVRPKRPRDDDSWFGHPEPAVVGSEAP